VSSPSEPLTSDSSLSVSDSSAAGNADEIRNEDYDVRSLFFGID